MANSKTSVTEGSGKNVATYSFSEDATTKEVQRIVLNTNAGVEISPATEAKQDDLIAIDYATEDTLGNIEDRIGSTSSSLPAADDTATVSLNGRLIRVAANITTLISTFVAYAGAKVTSITALETGGSGLIGWLSQIWREVAGIRVASERAITGSASGTAAPTTSAGTLVAGRTGRIGLILTNKGAVPVYIGVATVTTSQYRLDPGESMIWYSEQLVQGITASGTGSVHYVEFY